MQADSSFGDRLWKTSPETSWSDPGPPTPKDRAWLCRCQEDMGRPRRVRECHPFNHAFNRHNHPSSNAADTVRFEVTVRVGRDSLPILHLILLPLMLVPGVGHGQRRLRRVLPGSVSRRRANSNIPCRRDPCRPRSPHDAVRCRSVYCREP